MTLSSEDPHSHQPVKPDYCPDLGLKTDPLTVLHYPSDWNYCHHVRPAQTPKYQHQRVFCLSGKQECCPIFTAQPGKRMPGDIRYRHKIPAKMISIGYRTIIILIAIALLVVLFLYRGQIRAEVASRLMPAWQKTQVAASIVNATETPTITPTNMIEPTITPTNMIAPTITQTPTHTMTLVPTITSTRPAPVLDLGVPIGDEILFVIYAVNEGDVLELIARRFNTTPAAIRAINVFLTEVLWVDSVLVVPLDNEDVDGLPVFEPYQVAVSEIRIEDLAEERQFDLDAFIFYNHLWPGYILRAGEWVILPFDRE